MPILRWRLVESCLRGLDGRLTRHYRNQRYVEREGRVRKGDNQGWKLTKIIAILQNGIAWSKGALGWRSGAKTCCQNGFVGQCSLLSIQERNDCGGSASACKGSQYALYQESVPTFKGF